MTLEEKLLVQASWTRVAPVSEALAAILCSRLVEQQSVFLSEPPTALRQQGRSFLKQVSRWVRNLTQLELLGCAHWDPGVPPSENPFPHRHRDAVGRAFLWTLEKAHGDRFSPDLKDAWSRFYFQHTGGRTDEPSDPQDPRFLTHAMAA